MYRCGNKPEVGDCITIVVKINVQEMTAIPGDVAIVLSMNRKWSKGNPLLTIKRDDDRIVQIPANWCKLCQRK